MSGPGASGTRFSGTGLSQLMALLSLSLDLQTVRNQVATLSREERIDTNTNHHTNANACAATATPTPLAKALHALPLSALPLYFDVITSTLAVLINAVEQQASVASVVDAARVRSCAWKSDNDDGGESRIRGSDDDVDAKEDKMDNDDASDISSSHDDDPGSSLSSTVSATPTSSLASSSSSSSESSSSSSSSSSLSLRRLVLTGVYAEVPLTALVTSHMMKAYSIYTAFLEKQKASSRTKAGAGARNDDDDDDDGAEDEDILGGVSMRRGKSHFASSATSSSSSSSSSNVQQQQQLAPFNSSTAASSTTINPTSTSNSSSSDDTAGITISADEAANAGDLQVLAFYSSVLVGWVLKLCPSALVALLPCLGGSFGSLIEILQDVCIYIAVYYSDLYFSDAYAILLVEIVPAVFSFFYVSSLLIVAYILFSHPPPPLLSLYCTVSSFFPHTAAVYRIPVSRKRVDRGRARDTRCVAVLNATTRIKACVARERTFAALASCLKRTRDGG